MRCTIRLEHQAHCKNSARQGHHVVDGIVHYGGGKDSFCSESKDPTLVPCINNQHRYNHEEEEFVQVTICEDHSHATKHHVHENVTITTQVIGGILETFLCIL